MKYLLGIDQSTSGTKALIFDEAGIIVGRSDLPHEQKISQQGWVSHDPMEIYRNTVQAVKNLVAEAQVQPSSLVGVGISNQRETALVWDRETGLPVADAVVWQCARGAEICARLKAHGDLVKKVTGLPLSPYFSAAKIAWILENTPNLNKQSLCAGTMDSWLVYQLTGGKSFMTDYSNASRTQMFDLHTLTWSEEVCGLFGILPSMLAQVCDSNAHYGETDFEGFLPSPIPIHGVMGDSHGALFGQGCLEPGMAKATYGTGSSIMMNIGSEPIESRHGLATSLAWGIDGQVTYVLEGNINYTGAVIKWLVEDVQLIHASKESGVLAAQANPEDATYLVPAFTGLGAPHWNSEAKAVLYGMTRSTGKAEIVKAAEESIAYQITDVVEAMNQESGYPITELRVDGGPTRDAYLMQFQSDMLCAPVAVPAQEELSGIGAAYMAGIALDFYPREILQGIERTYFIPKMDEEYRQKKYAGWQEAIRCALR